MSSPLGDGISNVQKIAHMGDDLMVVNAARVSMAKESEWDECWFDPSLKYEDTKLIRFLAKHKHWTPFGHPQVQFRLKMPFFVAREWFRHEVGFVRNEVSRRYVTDDPEFFEPGTFRKRAENVKQGSSNERAPASGLHAIKMDNANTEALRVYRGMVEGGVAPEQARMVLPQSMYTEFIETGSLAAYARLCKLRDAPDAQKEIQLYAQAVSSVMANLFPESWEALNTY